MKKLTRLIKIFSSIIAASLAFVSMAQVPFTPGNIVVYRVGNGSAALATTTAAVVFIDEYTPSGVLVQSIPMPSTTGNLLTINGSVSTTGFLNLSTDGKNLVLAGYNISPGNSIASTTPKTIGLVDYNTFINTSTVLSDLTFILNSAITDNGTNLWHSGGNGVGYTTLGAATTTILSTSGARINIGGGQLYASGSGTPSIATVGSGLPTTSGQTVSNIPGIAAGAYYQFLFVDMNATIPGMDVLYAISANGIAKYSFDGTIWTQKGTIGTSADGYRGLTAKTSGTIVTLFASRKGGNSSTVLGGELVTLTDASGYSGVIAGTPTAIATITSIPGITTANTAAFRGLALVPQPPTPKVSLKIFLQGAYNSGLGRHKDVSASWAAILNANALNQPYNVAPFNYAGTESVAPGFFTSTGATTDVLDWVLLELRDQATPSTVIARRAAFVREDGSIVDLDGLSTVKFPNINSGSYFLVVRHRNHLAARTSVAVALDGNVYSADPALYDETTAQSQAFQDGAITTNAALKDVSGGGTVFGLWAGNANGNTTVRYTGLTNDAGVILAALGGNQALVSSNTYNSADLNMDGTVRYTGLNNDAGVLLGVLGSNQAAIFTQHQ